MFVVLAVILALAWVFGFAVYHVASVGIHLLLALAVIATVISAIMPGTPGVILSWVEVWREVLRRRSIGFRLALFS